MMSKKTQAKLIYFMMALAIGILVHKYIHHHPIFWPEKSGFAVLGDQEESPSRTSCSM